MSLILRHEPMKFGVLLDAEGFTPINELFEAIQSQHNDVTMDDIVNVVENVEPDKKRFTIVDNDIRANYGHSIEGKIQHEIAVPPTILYHGTHSSVVDQIRESGLKPMNRQYVHLTNNYTLAMRVGGRKGKPVILQIDAVGAHTDGVKFYKANDAFWLVDSLPSRFLSVAL